MAVAHQRHLVLRRRVGRRHGDGDRDRDAVAAVHRHRRCGPRRRERRQRLQVVAAEDRRGRRAQRVGVEREQPPRHGVDDADAALRVEADDAGGDALEDGLEVAPPRVGLEALALEIEARSIEALLARRELARHRVERLDERAELVVRVGLDAVIEMAGADLAGAGGEPLHRPRDALGEEQPHPGRADQDQQRQAEEEREVDALERLPQRVELGVVLIGLDDALPSGARARRSGRR